MRAWDGRFRRPPAFGRALVIGMGLLTGAPARAQEPPDAGRISLSCVEHVPKGATRPEIKESFPDRGFSGYAATLEITMTHGKGETVLPEGFKVQGGSDAARALEAAGFVIPDADGGSGPAATTETGQETSKTTLTIPFLALPKEPGRNAMVLPPVPVDVARANGELITLCTSPHPIVVDDPIANDRDPKVKPNPDARPQREEWVLAKQLAMGLLIGIAASLLGAWLLRRWRRRPKPMAIEPPKLPWIVALEELRQIRRSTLLAEARADEYFTRVSNCIRKYLGARYGFDGLESTTDEMQALLDRVRPKVPDIKSIRAFLADCDLVKFARLIPAEQDCLEALRRGEQIVFTTTPPSRGPGEADSRGARRPGAKTGKAAAPRRSEPDRKRAGS